MLRVLLLATISIALVIAAATFGQASQSSEELVSDGAMLEQSDTVISEEVDEQALESARSKVQSLASSFETVEAPVTTVPKELEEDVAPLLEEDEKPVVEEVENDIVETDPQ